jgi:hypothetical protein
MTPPVEDRPKSAPSPKSNFIALVLATILGGFVAFLVTQIQFSIEFDNRRSQSTQPSAPQFQNTSPTPSTSPNAKRATPVANGLRVSNQTAFPLRLVLLQGPLEPGTSSRGQKAKPTHWDFAPNEGSQNGLLLSLPKGELRLRSGDVLMAFALDGSRRYWGPYVVGETVLPRQTKPSKIWQLVIK